MRSSPTRAVVQQESEDRLACAARAPSQLRGQARVDAILDAAAAQVAEEGLASVTMHAVAGRAHTSTGSMYHFFPDRESLLRALMARHETAIGEITQALHATPAEVWKSLSTEAAIDRLMTPYVEYLQAHPEVLPLACDYKVSQTQNHTDFGRTVRQMIDARLPKAKAADRGNYAAVLHVIASGTMHVGPKVDPARSDVFLREVTRVLAAYLARIEADYE